MLNFALPLTEQYVQSLLYISTKTIAFSDSEFCFLKNFNSLQLYVLGLSECGRVCGSQRAALWNCLSLFTRVWGLGMEIRPEPMSLDLGIKLSNRTHPASDVSEASV